MRDVPVRHDRSCDGDRPIGIVRGFANSPLAFRIARITRNDCPRRTFEAADAVRIPAAHVSSREHLCLLADRVTGGNAVEAARDAIGHRDSHRDGTAVERVRRAVVSGPIKVM